MTAILALCIALNSLLFAALCFGQEVTLAQINAALPAVAKTILKHRGVDPESKEAKDFEDMMMRRKTAAAAPAPGKSAPKFHFVFKEGKELPSPQLIAQEQDKLNIKLVALMEANRKKHEQDKKPESDEGRLVTAAEPSKVITLPVCEKSATLELPIPEDFIAQGKKIDLLFFNGKPPFEIETAIGKKTVLVPFGEEDSAEMVSPFGNLDIECVPYRLRSTGDKVIYSKGALALKNYDADPESNGTFDPTVKKYIQQNNLQE